MNITRAILVFALLALVSVPAVAAEDKTVAYGETLAVSSDTTFAKLVVNGTLNVAEGVRLTCETFTLGDNLDHTQDKVAKMTVGTNATVSVSGTGTALVGVNSRAELTLCGGSTFSTGGGMDLAPNCTATVAKVVYVKVNVNDATLNITGPLLMKGYRRDADSVENAVLSLNGSKAVVSPRFAGVSGHYNNARIRFNGGKLLTGGWYNWGQQAALNCANCAEKLWVDSVDGNPIWIRSQGGEATRSFFANPQSWLGASFYYFSGTGPIVLEGTGSAAVPICWTDSYQGGFSFGQTGGIRLVGKVSLGNAKSASVAAAALANSKLELAAGSEFDVCGNSLAVGEMESTGAIVNSVEAESVLTVGGNNGNVVLSSPTLSEGVKMVKVGSGKLFAPAGPLANIEVQAGSFDFCDRKSVGFPYYRYWVYRRSQGGGDGGSHCDVVKLSEFELYKDGVSVRNQATDVSWVQYGVNDRSPKNLFTTNDTEIWASEWYKVSDARSTNNLFAAIHLGGAPVQFANSGVVVHDAIDNAPVAGKIVQPVTSYKYRLGSTGWYGYTNPEYFRFQGGLGNDTWVDLEDWESRGRYTKLNHSNSYQWSEEFALTYPINPVSVENLTVAAGAEWTLDCSQADLTVGTLTLGGSGTLRITNFGKVKGGKPLPVKYTAIGGADNLKDWDVHVDGVLCDRRILAENGQLVFDRKGLAIIFR